MKARIDSHNRNGKNFDDKRLLQALVGIAVVRGTIHHLVNVKTYVSKSSIAVNYVSVHANNANFSAVCVGSSQAGGSGYHRPSAAMQGALTSAGIALVDEKTGHPVPIDGRGGSIMEDAVLAIMKALEPEAESYKVIVV